MFPFVDKMSVSDSLLNVSKSVLNYATIIKGRLLYLLDSVSCQIQSYKEKALARV